MGHMVHMGQSMGLSLMLRSNFRLYPPTWGTWGTVQKPGLLQSATPEIFLIPGTRVWIRATIWERQ